MQTNYPVCYKAVRAYEGGNDDDPQDPGGRTSRGIIQREWTEFRKTHPGRPADVWKASEEDIATIYKGDYWDRQRLDEVAAGLDETQFDYGVNSGVGRSSKVLRRCLHMADNAPSADVRARLSELNNDQIKTLIVAINDERLAFLKSLKTWKRFGGGWGRRVASVKALSLKLAAAPAIVPEIPTPPVEASAKGQHAEPTVAKKTVQAGTAGGSAAGATTWYDWIAGHPIETALIAIVVIAALGYVIYRINAWHKVRQEAPAPGWAPPPELAPAR